MDSGSPVESVDQNEVEEFSCSLADQLELDCHMSQLCGLELQSTRLSGREAKGIHLSHGTVLLPLFDGFMHRILNYLDLWG